MLRITATLTSSESRSEAPGKTRREVENANANGAKIGGVKLAKAKTLTKVKNFAKCKIAKAMHADNKVEILMLRIQEFFQFFSKFL